MDKSSRLLIPVSRLEWFRRRELRQRVCEDVRIQSVVPAGDQGLLRYIKSRKLNKLVSLAVGSAWLDHVKERAMLGHALIAWGTK